VENFLLFHGGQLTAVAIRISIMLHFEWFGTTEKLLPKAL
jgi:hypothetical protein